MTARPCPFWFEDRSKPEAQARERKHLRDMEAHERRMIAAGYQIRPKVKR